MHYLLAASVHSDEAHMGWSSFVLKQLCLLLVISPQIGDSSTLAALLRHTQASLKIMVLDRGSIASWGQHLA